MCPIFLKINTDIKSISWFSVKIDRNQQCNKPRTATLPELHILPHGKCLTYCNHICHLPGTNVGCNDAHDYVRHRFTFLKRQSPPAAQAVSPVSHTRRRRSEMTSAGQSLYARILLLLLLLCGWWRTLKSFTEWRIVSAGGHESRKVSSVVKFRLYQSFENCKTGKVWDYV